MPLHRLFRREGDPEFRLAIAVKFDCPFQLFYQRDDELKPQGLRLTEIQPFGKSTPVIPYGKDDLIVI